MNLTPLVSAFFLILITELGDKTMITAIVLSSRYNRIEVFLGTLLALTALSILGVILGSLIFQHVPVEIAQFLAGAIFITVGAYQLVNGEESTSPISTGYGGMFTSFIMISMMELGDKSQLAIIGLSAESGAGELVLLGAILAFALITLIGVGLGHEISKRVDEDIIRKISAAIFIILGVFFMLQTVF